MRESAASGRDGAARWLAIHDELLRGLAHALSNRVATVAAAAYLIETQERPSVASAQLLRVEADQLEGILQLVRLLPRREAAEMEPVMAIDAARTAIELHAHHVALHGIACEVLVADAVLPTWADRVALQQAIAVGIGIGKRAAAVGSDVRITISSSADVGRIDIETATRSEAHSPDDLLDIRAARWLLMPSDGRALLTDRGCAIEVPTLSAARRDRRP